MKVRFLNEAVPVLGNRNLLSMIGNMDFKSWSHEDVILMHIVLSSMEQREKHPYDDKEIMVKHPYSVRLTDGNFGNYFIKPNYLCFSCSDYFDSEGLIWNSVFLLDKHEKKKDSEFSFVTLHSEKIPVNDRKERKRNSEMTRKFVHKLSMKSEEELSDYFQTHSDF